MRRLNPFLYLVRKELGGFFHSPVVYLFLIIFLVINNFFTFRSIFLFGVANIRSMFESLMWMLLFLVPPVTMRMLAEEKRSQTIDILFSLPVKEWQIILAKFTAAFIVILIALGLTLSIPFSLAPFGQFDPGLLLAQYLGTFLLGIVMVMVGLFASSLTKHQITAFLLSLVFLFILILVGFDTVLSSLPFRAKPVIEQLSLVWHFRNIARGVIDLRDFVYFATVSIFFFFLTLWFLIQDRIIAKRMVWRRFKAGIVLIGVLGVLMNALSIGFHERLDLTGSKIYTLSPATKKVLGGLPDLVSITLYISRELPTEISTTVRDVKDLLQDMESSAKGQFKIEEKIVDEGSAAEAERAGITPVQFNVVKSDQFRVQRGYFGLAAQYLDEKEVLPFIEESDDFEYRLISTIRTMTKEKKSTLGFLSGHEEKTIGADYGALEEQLGRQYEMTSVTFDEKEKKLSSEPDLLVVAGPQSEIKDEERSVIEAYLERGGKILALIDGVEVSRETLFVTKRPESIGKIFDSFGAKVNPDLVGDLLAGESVSFGGGAFNIVLPYPYWVKAVSQKNHPAIQEIPGILLPWPSTITIESKDGVEVQELFKTTEKGFVQKENFQIRPDVDVNTLGGEQKSYLLAAALTKKNAEGKEGGRVVVVGNSDFLLDDFVRSNPENLIFGLNLVDWLVQDEELITVRSKPRQSAPLLFPDPRVREIVKYENLVGVPLLVAGLGFFHLYRRRKKSLKQYPG